MDNLENKNVNTATETEPNVGAETEKNNDALFQKLDDILAKRSEGIAKSILKENGIDNDELKDILNEYKQHKAAKTKTVETEIAELKRVNAELNQKIKTGERNAVINKAATELGISSDNLKYVTKLADLTNIEKDGKVDAEAVKAALKSVIDEVPAFKGETKTEPETTGFVKVGSQKTEETKDDLGANRIRKLMGLPEIKK